ncbi:hypothetical protein E2C01_029252 [Portunus trituberculatus]|uniref:Uncharacterized protein n=1 Tax=Portunus trituberculatus TaxID=210409 RepID=A0A5B7ERG6_PORTR|nr:hypothetical protein [Portunus trituberculatus]
MSTLKMKPRQAAKTMTDEKRHALTQHQNQPLFQEPENVGINGGQDPQKPEGRSKSEEDVTEGINVKQPRIGMVARGMEGPVISLYPPSHLARKCTKMQVMMCAGRERVGRSQVSG